MLPFLYYLYSQNSTSKARWTHTRTLYCNTRQRRTHSLWMTSGGGRKQEPVRCRTDTGGACRIQEVVIGSNSYLNTLFASNKCCVFYHMVRHIFSHSVNRLTMRDSCFVSESPPLGSLRNTHIAYFGLSDGVKPAKHISSTGPDPL